MGFTPWRQQNNNVIHTIWRMLMLFELSKCVVAAQCILFPYKAVSVPVALWALDFMLGWNSHCNEKWFSFSFFFLSKQVRCKWTAWAESCLVVSWLLFHNIERHNYSSCRFLRFEIFRKTNSEWCQLLEDFVSIVPLPGTAAEKKPAAGREWLIFPSVNLMHCGVFVVVFFYTFPCISNA